MNKSKNLKSVPTKLRTAVKNSNKDIILDVLDKHDVDLNEVDSNGNTYLHSALSKGTEGKSKCEKIIDILTILLDHGINIDLKNNFGRTVLHSAILHRSIEIVNYLIERNADINVIDKRGNSIVHTLIENEYDTFKRLPSKTSIKKREWLERQSIYFINLLLTKGFDFDCRNSNGVSALHMAIEYNLHHVLPTLLASTNGIDYIDKSNRSLLQMFIQINYFHCDRSPSSTTFYGDRYVSNIIKTLFDKSISLDVVDIEGKTALQFAFEITDINVIKLIIDNADEDHEKSLTEFLHHLIKNDISLYLNTEDVRILGDIIKTLISKTIKFQNVPISNITTVQLAVLEKRLDILKLLRENQIGFDVLTFDGNNLLHLLSHKKETNKIKHEKDKEYEEIFDILASLGCDVNATNRMKQTPLHEAVANGKILVIMKLIQHGVDVNSRKDKLMWTPLHIAADCDQQPEVAELLIKNGANVNLKDECGRTPLHLTLENGGGLTKILLSSGALADVQDKRKRTPLYLAISKKLLQEVEELLKYGANFNDFFPIRSHVPILDEDPTRGRILLDFILPTHWIKLSVAGLPCSTQYKILVNRKNFQNCYDDCRKEIEKLKNFFIDDRITILQFLQMNPNRRCTYVNSEKFEKFIKSPFNELFPNYSNLIFAAYRDALTRKPLLGLAMRGWFALTKVILTDICVDRILSHLGVADLLNLICED